MFDLSFSNGDAVSFYGADIGSSLTFTSGVDVVAAGVQMLPATGVGIVVVRVGSTGGVGVTPFGAVPETSTWVMMTLGFAGVAFAGYRRSRKRAVVA
jgi:hypothetical protein